MRLPMFREGDGAAGYKALLSVVLGYEPSCRHVPTSDAGQAAVGPWQPWVRGSRPALPRPHVEPGPLICMGPPGKEGSGTCCIEKAFFGL